DPPPASITDSSSDTDGARRYAGFCAPHSAADRYGPSKWIPAIVWSSTSGAYAVVTASITSYGLLTRLASIVVVPCDRWNAAAPRADATSPVVNVCPPPPWTCVSTNPGTSHGASSGIGAGEIAAIRSSTSST